MKGKKKILRVISSVDKKNGGPINGLINSSEILEMRGHVIDVLSLDEPNKIDSENFEFTLYNFRSYLGKFSYSPKFHNWLCDNVCKYDVVIIHGLWQYHSYITSKVCLKNEVPYVVFSHGMLDPWFNKQFPIKALKKRFYWNFFEKHVVNKANKVLFTSEEEKILARESFYPYKPNEWVVAYGCENPPKNLDHSGKLFQKERPILNGERYILYLSRIHKKKGVDLLIDSYAKSDLHNRGIKLAIAGPGDEKFIKKLKQRSEELGIKNSIFWLGMLQGEVKWGAYHLADAFILPSHQENFGIVVAEALSTSTPVLITNKVNIWREINRFNAGFVENDNLDGVYNLLEKWANTTDKDKIMIREQSYNCYRANFSMLSAVNSLESLLTEISNQGECRV